MVEWDDDGHFRHRSFPKHHGHHAFLRILTQNMSIFQLGVGEVLD